MTKAEAKQIIDASDYFWLRPTEEEYAALGFASDQLAIDDGELANKISRICRDSQSTEMALTEIAFEAEKMLKEPIKIKCLIGQQLHLPETKLDIPMPEVKEPKKSSQAAAGQWIPVKNESWPRFLEDGQEYLITTAYNSVCLDEYCEDLDENGELIGWFDNTDADDVVAIMELPEPYKGA